MDDLTRVAEINGGYLMRHQLLEIGLSDLMIRQALKARVLQRVRHGTYVTYDPWAAMNEAERHAVMVRSVLDKLGDSVAASHQSASALLGHDLFDVDLSAVHVTRLDGRSGRREAGVVFHHGSVLPVEDIREVDGRLVVEPMRAVFEACSLSSIESGVVLASSALRNGAFGKKELEESGRRFHHWRGTRTARIAIRLADGQLESVGEARSLHMFWRHHVPYPELQHVVSDINGQILARTDFAWLACRHTGEFDGLFKYGRLNPYADPGEAIAQEKIREDLVRDESLGMSRWTWAGLAPGQQSATVRMIERAMARSKKLYLRNSTVIPLS